jgi:hypothetical protein
LYDIKIESSIQDLVSGICNFPHCSSNESCRNKSLGFFCKRHENFAEYFNFPIKDDLDSDIQMKPLTIKKSQTCSFEKNTCNNTAKHPDRNYPDMGYCDLHVYLNDESIDSVEINRLDTLVKKFMNCRLLKKRFIIQRYKLSQKHSIGVPSEYLEFLGTS